MGHKIDEIILQNFYSYNYCRIYDISKKYLNITLPLIVWFYDIPTIVGYLMLNPVYTHALDIYDL